MKGLSMHYKGRLKAFLIKDYELNGNDLSFFQQFKKDVIGIVKVFIVFYLCLALFLFCL